ncbi:MAG: response regulator transcription factor [Clostridia bacterium]|nr:response regulator transcription factor [Clostridia bacterium]MBQ7094788.1 response regulator transcription factor [Clostridia bacterium]
MPKKVLIVEDEKAISDIIMFNLKREGYEVMQALTGTDGLNMALNENPDIVLLDIMLPEMDGFEVLEKIREVSEVPVIMVTAREEERDKVLGLETGADDYVTKPFSMVELIARVKANTRRTVGAVKKPETSIKIGDITIDTEAQTVMKNDAALDLTQREYEIMVYFAKNQTKVVSREELMEKVWGYDYYGDLRAVDVAMRRLREKIEDDPSEPKLIITKRGVGYYLGK